VSEHDASGVRRLAPPLQRLKRFCALETAVRENRNLNPISPYEEGSALLLEHGHDASGVRRERRALAGSSAFRA